MIRRYNNPNPLGLEIGDKVTIINKSIGRSFEGVIKQLGRKNIEGYFCRYDSTDTYTMSKDGSQKISKVNMYVLSYREDGLDGGDFYLESDFIIPYKKKREKKKKIEFFNDGDFLL